MQHPFQPPRITPVPLETYATTAVSADVLRLDEMHPVISGNKWFKLKEHLAEARQHGKKGILTFGGAYSNHIVATAAACSLQGFFSAGIIRGERPPVLSHTLQEAQGYGMRLHFVSRNEYRNKTVPPEAYGDLKKLETYIIAEGGSGTLGVLGSMGILKSLNTETYTHIVAAVGTGTMLAGLIRTSLPHQRVIGISVLKNNFSVEDDVKGFVDLSKAFTIRHDFHFGGYAKHTPALLRFMNEWYRQTGIPTDFVYTAKMFYALDQLIKTGFFPKGSSVLAIHSGGLQGNRSLAPGAVC